MAGNIQELARAKVNLTLHVGRVITDADRFHGYHPLDSLVVFADIGDVITVEPADAYSLEIIGPFADALKSEADNLVSRAVRVAAGLIQEGLGKDGNVRVTLDKRLPVSSGLGGGSADAAAVLRALVPETVPREKLMEVALSLGADVPACVMNRTLRMTGIGDSLAAVPGVGSVAAVLANPGVAVSTPEVFRRFDSGGDIRETPRPQKHEGNLLARAQDGRNDLEPPAIARVPEVGELIRDMSAQAGCKLARMSGSGASVFGVFGSDAEAKAAAATLLQDGHWAVACRLGETDDG